MSAESVRAASRWTTRVIPIILAGSVGYATYVTVARVCVDHLINKRHDAGAAIAILIIYFLFMLLMIATYIRTIWMINSDAGLVPLGPLAVKRRAGEKQHRGRSGNTDDVESQPYDTAPDPNPDSPGLEQFYTKDVFVCENDGRPKWCSQCCNWKPDRAHHSSEINRCVIRMDHYCPWVGGMIGENSFKFFTQFTMYTACYCGIVLGAAGSSLRDQINDGNMDGHLIGALGLGGFFGLFTSLMTLTSWRYITTNMTNVDMLGANHKVYQLAVSIPRSIGATDKFQTVTYPLPKPGDTLEHKGNGTIRNGQAQHDGSGDVQGPRATTRDKLANRTFAILRTEPGENPWHLGIYQNWKDVMGTTILDWFLPLRRSPCVNHDSHEGFYRMGRVMNDIKARYGIDATSSDEADRLELRAL